MHIRGELLCFRGRQDDALVREAVRVNVRELWDTVVLRDILGYVVPGSVTLLALSLLGPLLGFRACGAGVCKLLTTYRWLLGAVLVPASYVVGNVQAQLVERLERKDWVPSANHGRTALQFLKAKDHEMGHEYCEAALEVLDKDHRKRFSELCTRLKRDQWNHQAEGQNDRETDQETEHEDERKAKDLWRLCDYYVLGAAPDLHATYMGRYYVLAVLFSNLGVSTIILGFSSLALVSSAYHFDPFAGVPLLFVVGLILALTYRSGYRQQVRRRVLDTVGAAGSRVRYILTLAGLCGLAFLVHSRVIDPTECGVAVVALVLPPFLVGLTLIWRSGFFRRQFVERTFPTFYALTLEQRERRRVAAEARLRQRIARRVERGRKPRTPRSADG